MDELTEQTDAVNPFARTFFCLWALASLVLAGFRADNVPATGATPFKTTPKIVAHSLPVATGAKPVYPAYKSRGGNVRALPINY